MFGFAKTKEEQDIADKRCFSCKYLDYNLRQCTIRYNVKQTPTVDKSICGSFELGNPEEMATTKRIENRNW